MTKILIVEDNATLREGIVQVVQRMGFQACSAPGGRQGLEVYRAEGADLVISDIKMDGLDGIELLEQIMSIDSEQPVIMITAFASIELAVKAMKKGAFDFIPKPFPPDLLRTKIEKALQARSQRRQNAWLREENAMLRQQAGVADIAEIVGQSEPMRKIFDLVHKVAKTDSTVFIHGESGTGKELVARALHERSTRAEGPFVKVNCAALAETLLESELFGHEKGSFTGAHQRRLGRFELADTGTLFLDEIGEIDASLQVKLLRVLQERSFERVGGEQTVHVDVRLITATNRNLEKEVEQGRFREDLYYRLHIIPVRLPPLRERLSDVPALIAHFIDKLGQRTRTHVEGVSDEAMRVLKSYAWPGNVRELENVIEHALVFAEGEVIEVDDLPSAITGCRSEDILPMPDGDRTLPDILEDLERRLIVRAFERAEGVKTETARLLGIKTSALYYKLDKYGIHSD